jgi:hypothetical protein
MGDGPIYEELGMYLRKLIYKQNGAIYTFIFEKKSTHVKSTFQKKSYWKICTHVFFLELGFTMNAKTYFQKNYAKLLRAWGKHDNTYQFFFTIQTSQIALLGICWFPTYIVDLVKHLFDIVETHSLWFYMLLNIPINHF